jgi:uncharacterized protein YfaP (DUF2135 family)
MVAPYNFPEKSGGVSILSAGTQNAVLQFFSDKYVGIIRWKILP